MYIYGGMNSSYCFLSDLHMLDLKNWTWRKLVCTDPAWRFRPGGTTLPGHSLIAWNNKLLLMVGHTKDLSQETILMKEFDPLKMFGWTSRLKKRIDHLHEEVNL
ncbi:hypothetical protein DM860_016765 [Cuscuta australis]|uniref:F-box associated domain-containing protein n=1 Tax=Cuscuta australis TaxID=267555 RepID=A0A328DD72_9ASTE|nr:hypothetical protein DM860_016765 [Cuscuta australis]